MKKYRFGPLIRPVLTLFVLLFLLNGCADKADYVFLVTEERDPVSDASETVVESEPPSTAAQERETNAETSPIPDVTLSETTVVSANDAPFLPETTVTETDAVPSLTVIRLTETVSCGKEATLTVSGIPNTVYSIEVHYSTTVSTAQGLEPKTADENGTVTWTWKVGSRTNPGSYRIIVYGGEDRIALSFTVTGKS